MKIKELKSLLQEPYKTENWRTLLRYVFDHVQFLDEPSFIPTDDSRVQELKQYGTVKLEDGKNLALFELTLNDNVNLVRNRVGLNELVKKYIDQDSYHGILSVFEQGQEDYRFTFTARDTEFDEEEGFIDKDTDTKRFTYILGKNESCRTAAERFEKLSKTENKDLKAVEEAFNVEKLSKKFFDEYIDQFNTLVDYLKNKSTYFQGIFEKDETQTRNYVKRFMGRLVFLKFVQKKGWLGVPLSEDGWQNGDYNFLENQYKEFKAKNLFVSQFLNPLFYEGLDSGQRPNYQFKDAGYKIPYLSGGLFDNENQKDNRIDFEEPYLTSLFQFLERYNFTINENDLNDKEVGIDPEMLGHIFENLLEDNKDKGAFYTPKEIVRYMCQESLKEYLKTYLQKQNQWPNDELKQKELDDALHNFITKKEASHVIEFERSLATALKEVKICDPAIGSGAFPMGLLHEIFNCVQVLFGPGNNITKEVWELNGWDAEKVKLNIIQRSIYGVDIEKGAVEIARLRFWLSLIVDSDEPQALPHLDYKIVVGDSLVSKLEDTIIDIDWDLEPKLIQADIFGNEGKVSEKRKLIKEISDLQKQIFDPDCDDEELALKIRNKKIDLLILQLEIMIDEEGVTDKPQGTGRKLKAMTEKWLETNGWKKQIKRLNKMKTGSKTPLEFFDWKLDFPEIMNPEVTTKTGFDIVIANPPYLDYRKIDREVIESKDYPICKSSSRPNLYQYFVELADSLLKNKGSFCFINPNQFLSTNNGLQLRTYLLNNCEIRFIVDVSYIKIFEVASTYTIVWLYRKNKINNNKIRISRCLKLTNLNKTSFTISQYDTKSINGKIIPLNIEYFKLQKIEKNKKTLADIATLKWGTSASGYGAKKISSNDFVQLNVQDKKLYKPILQTSDIKKYYVDWKKEYIPIDIFSESIISEFNKEKLLIARVTKRIQACLDFDNHFVGKSTVVTNSKIDFKVLLALINSFFVNYWYYLKFESTHMAGGYLRFDIPYLSQIPIPEISKGIQEKLIQKVSEIIRIKSKNIGQEISSLEQQINNLVYKLYGLTYDEVLVIEPEFRERMSKEAYEALEVE